MTKEEREIALYCLKVSSDYHSEVCEECVKYPNCDHTIQDDVTETIIKALEQQPCEDCISRADAINLVHDLAQPCDDSLDWDIPADEMIDGIKSLPSVQQQPCDDCISREALRQKLQDHHDFFVNAYGSYNMTFKEKARVDEINNCIAMVVNAPSVTPQPKIGRWEKVFDEHSYWYKCSCCGEKIPKNFWGNDYFSSYCPECGAKMEGEKDGNLDESHK